MMVKRLLFLLPLLLAVYGCSTPEHDLAPLLAPQGDEAAAFRKKAEEFIQYAQDANVDAMISVTSPATFATQAASIRDIYENQVVPQFKGTVVTWKDGNISNIDEHHNAGLLFTGTATGKSTFSFDVAVAKENGQIVIINIRKHR
jgi:hypothetical protein